MNNIIEFFSIILFSHTVILTPTPINIERGETEVALPEPISVITEGAALYIDVSMMLPEGERTVRRAREWVENTFLDGSIKVTLTNSESEKEVFLLFSGDSL